MRWICRSGPIRNIVDAIDVTDPTEYRIANRAMFPIHKNGIEMIDNAMPDATHTPKPMKRCSSGGVGQCIHTWPAINASAVDDALRAGGQIAQKRTHSQGHTRRVTLAGSHSQGHTRRVTREAGGHPSLSGVLRCVEASHTLNDVVDEQGVAAAAAC
eukprot:353149-Chlamydomonas_euryale.AAC.16